MKHLNYEDIDIHQCWFCLLIVTTRSFWENNHSKMLAIPNVELLSNGFFMIMSWIVRLSQWFTSIRISEVGSAPLSFQGASALLVSKDTHFWSIEMPPGKVTPIVLNPVDPRCHPFLASINPTVVRYTLVFSGISTYNGMIPWRSLCGRYSSTKSISRILMHNHIEW